jgi:hypothetical protein
MIRKPTERDFQEGEAVKALRETHKVAVEGSKGIGQGIGRMYAIWFGVTMAFGLGMSLVIATSGLALIPIAIGGIWYLRWRKGNEAAKVAMLRSEQDRILREAQISRAVSAGSDRSDAAADVAFPASVRRHGVIEADIGAVAQQAFMLLVAAFILLFVVNIASGIVGLIFGAAAMMLAALIGSRAFGHRKVIEWDTRKVKVWHLLSEAEMQWSDVVDVTVEKASRTNLVVYFQSGSRRNIIIRALVNRLGGPTVLRVPIRHMNLPEAELQDLLRDLMCWRAAGNSAGPAAAHSRQPVNDTPFAAAITPLSDPRESFDPDAIMERYMRDRQQTLEAAGRPDVSPVRAPSPLEQQRPVFGRKRA